MDRGDSGLHKRAGRSSVSSCGMKVIVVGAGLVGSLCSCYFGQKGHEVHIYEYRNDPRKEKLSPGRSINLALSTRGRAALALAGLEETMLTSAIPMRGRMIHPVQGRNRSIPYDPVHKQCIFSVGRKHLNEILIAEAEKHKNVYMHFNHKIISIDLEEGKIIFQRLTDGNSIGEDSADLIVGADGAYSVVRKQMSKQPMFSFSQTYIEHGYVELAIPPENNYLMESNHLHIWPRGQFMLIALPNQDRSWTVTLFMPLDKFTEIQERDGIVPFFKMFFPDALRFIGEEKLQEQLSVGASNLVSIKCSRYHVKGKVVIIGDAAHAMVPFYGQGMNAGFEDCRILDDLIHNYNLSLEDALSTFSKTRRDDAEAICDLAMYNYIEMRDLVNRPSYLLRKKLDNFLYNLIPSYWLPLYQSVTFTNTPYHLCMKNKDWQDAVLKWIGASAGIVACSYIAYALLNRRLYIK